MKSEQPSGGEFSFEDEPTVKGDPNCRHHWRLPAPNGEPMVMGSCLKCPARKPFASSIELAVELSQTHRNVEVSDE